VAAPADAFSPEWIGTGGRAHVTRYAPDPARAVGLVRAAGGVTVLAHPRGQSRGWAVPDEVIAGLAAAGLAGLEVSHPQHDPAQRAALAVLAADLGLVASAGSDDHGALTGFRIGTETAGRAVYEQLTGAATGARPVTGGRPSTPTADRSGADAGTDRPGERPGEHLDRR
jgi:3',5'-nucleoside bisphosphate phosphatase